MKKPVKSLSQSQGYALVERYYHSSMSVKEFCDKEQISDYQYYKWRKLYFVAYPEKASLYNSQGIIPKTTTFSSKANDNRINFGDIVITDPPTELPSISTLSSIDLHYPNGVRLSLPSSISAEQLSSYIKLY